MSVLTLPWVGTALIVLAILLVIASTLALLSRTARTTTARLYCPWARRSVVVQYATTEEGRPVSVIACSAFADSRAVTCCMPCLSGGVPAGAPPEAETTLADLLAD